MKNLSSMFGKRMNNDNKSFTILAYFAVIFSAVCLLMLGLYFWSFGGSLSDRPADWDAFGSYFGSITGLLAFIGVLVTFYLSEKRNRDRYDATSERDVFYRLLDLYLNQKKTIESVTIKDAIDTSEDNFEKLSNIASDYFYLHAIYSYVKLLEDKNIRCNFDLFIQNSSLGNQCLDLLLSSYKIKDISVLIQKCKKNTFDSKDLFWESVNLKYEEHEIREMRPLLCSDEKSKELFERLYLHVFEDFDDIVEISSHAHFVGDLMYKDYKQYLGQYFRTIYYLLEVVDVFKDAKLYLAIFRSQLSTNELSLLLYNAASSQATARTVDLFVNHAIFNNIAVEHPIIRMKNQKVDDLDYISRLLK